MKQCLTIVLAVGMVVAFVGVAQAEQGAPSQATLRAMGLSGMQVMSDRDAMGVRGMGYYSSNKSTAIAFGISYARVGGYGAGAGSVDGFFAKGKYYASGKHGSVAGKIVIKYGGKGGPPMNGEYTNGGGNGGPSYGGGGGGVKVKAVVVFAGGFAVSQAY